MFKEKAIKQVLLILFGLLLISLMACTEQTTQTQTLIKVSVLPDQSNEKLVKRYKNLLDYLGDKTGIVFQLVLSENYDDLLLRFQRGEIDIARFGGATFARANNEFNAIPLVMRDVDVKFTSYFLARKSDSQKKLSDFKGKKFGFGSPLSTSGHFMPRYILSQQNIHPETFFSSVEYSGAHDKTARWVIEGKIDIGVANSVIIDNLFRSGKINQNDISIISQSPPFADYVWAAQSDLPKPIQNSIIDAFLELSTSDRRNKLILDEVGASAYLPARVEDFSALFSVLKNMKIL